MPRRLGQHHLFDPSILDRIVDAIDPQPTDTVIEIGPGTGSLTTRLARRVGRVIAIEKDERFAARLEEDFRTTDRLNIEIVHADALRVDWHDLVGENARRAPPAAKPAQRAEPQQDPRPVHEPAAPFKVVGNIPYYITTPLIDKVLSPPLPTVIVFLIQAEVAARVVASPGAKVYGALSVGVQVAAEAERLFSVPAGAFRPPPNVESAVLRLVPRASPHIPPVEHPAFRRFVVAVFSQRRKQLGRSIATLLGLTREAAERRLRMVGIDPTSRPEVVTPQDFVRLYRCETR